jgi:hypothetical protein
MIDKQIIVLLSLAFLAVVTLAAPHAKTFREEWIEWGKNPHIDQFGGSVDVDTECNGKPCNFPEEIVPYSSEELSGPYCVPIDNDQVICNYLPQNATLVFESEFDRIFPGSSNSIPDSPQPPILMASSKGSGPEPSQASQVSSTSKGSVPQPSQTSQLFSVSKRSIPKPSQASHSRLASNGTAPKHAEPLSKLEKRSRFILDGGSNHWVWQSNAKITYRIAFVDALKTEKLKVTAAVSNAIEYWENQCGVPGQRIFCQLELPRSRIIFADGEYLVPFCEGCSMRQASCICLRLFSHRITDKERLSMSTGTSIRAKGPKALH